MFVSPQYLHQYANHAAWLEDYRRTDNVTLAKIMASNAMGSPVSRNLKGYWQRAAWCLVSARYPRVSSGLSSICLNHPASRLRILLCIDWCSLLRFAVPPHHKSAWHFHRSSEGQRRIDPSFLLPSIKSHTNFGASYCHWWHIWTHLLLVLY